MNTNQLKRFAQEARTKLLRQVGAKMDFVLSHDTAGLRGRADTLQKLQEEIRRHGKEAVIDKVAYTWFNRLVALRFMDVNGYQPIGMSVVTPATPSHVSPQILTEAHSGNIPGELKVNREQLFDILDGRQPSNNPDNDVYRMLLVAACNNLSYLFPFLFERIEDYTELLLPDDLTSPFSIVTDIVNGMADEDCREVEIIGWLYQFYISEKKDEVFASKSAVKKEDIPAATQLFTPRWIVEYMVQNTVGKLWLQNRPSSHIREHMPYYIESESGSTTDYLKLESIEDLKLLDQACGSGHILVYGFELLHKIYEEEGYSPAEIPQLIIEKNLYGLEIDERAAQLAGFALMMKARGYHRRFFRREVKPNIKCFSDLTLGADEVKAIFKELHIPLSETLEEDLDLCRQATNLGSLIQPQTPLETLEEINNLLTGKLETSNLFSQSTIQELQRAISQLISLRQKYHCVVDNPPYMGGGNMNKELSTFVKKNYPDSKADLMACFMESGLASLHPKGFLGMINQHSWMFLSSYEKLRGKLIDNIQFDTLLHLGPGTFPEIGGEVVQNASFTFFKAKPINKGSYVRLVDFDNSELKRNKALEAIQNPNCGWFYTANQKDFKKIPGSPIGYWLSEKYFKIFKESPNIHKQFPPKVGLQTGNNDKFLRNWHEVSYVKNGFYLTASAFAQQKKKWAPYNKGGNYRKWYGNQELVINWFNNGSEIYNYRPKSVLRNADFYFLEGLNWSLTSSRGKFAIRYKNIGFIFDVNGMSILIDSETKYFILGILNSIVGNTFLNVLNPTLAFQAGDISKFPLILRSGLYLNKLVINNISISKSDWDSRETSWDFKTSPLFDGLLGDLNMASSQFVKSRIEAKLREGVTLKDAYQEYIKIWTSMFFQLHRNEEELNRQFIEIYGLQDELTPDVPLEEITILQEETSIENGELVFHADEVFAQFVSYAVGCMFGRYSLDKEGLILANQGETLQDYLEKVGRREEELTFVPDRDNIIPVLDDEWFSDDIVERFHTFLKASFGEQNFRKNRDFVEECLGKDIRKYFTRDFYKDHIRRYKKRPIYWMFSSPKGYFNVLVYLHRYTPDTINRILNSYLKEFIEKLKMYRTQQEHIEVEGSVTEQNKARKEIDRINVMLEDCMQYETEILYPLAAERIALDLDDGVLVNYNKLGSAVALVDGLNDKKTKKKVRGFDWIDVSQIRD
jgi:type II restriction/modification system DNA methylase subunit YeeA